MRAHLRCRLEEFIRATKPTSERVAELREAVRCIESNVLSGGKDLRQDIDFATYGMEPKP